MIPHGGYVGQVGDKKDPEVSPGAVADLYAYLPMLD